jgi:host factor-I protein
MSSPNALQNQFLDDMVAANKTIAIYLVSGIKLVGRIVGYDAYVILLQHDVPQMVHKHAIATIMPAVASARQPLASKTAETRAA